MKNRVIVATLIDPGECTFYGAGTMFTLDGHRTHLQSLCQKGDKGLAIVAKCLLNSPSPPEVPIVIRCPHHVHGAVWELKVKCESQTPK